MKRFILLSFVLVLSLVSCAGKGVDPNYQAMLDGYKALADKQAAQDRAIFTLEAGNKPITLPPGAKLTVNAQPPELQYPSAFRDYGREAAYQFWGNVVNSVTGVGLSGLFGWLGQKENRKMFEGVWTNRQGISFNATKDINFSGGIGDYGQRGYSSTITPAPVINQPTVIPPVVNNPTVINPPVIVQPVIPAKDP